MVKATGKIGNRRALATIEIVLAAGVGLPVAVSLLFLGFRMCKYLYQASATLVGCPYL